MAKVTFKENPITLLGNEVKVGDKAPNFSVLANDLSAFTLENLQNKVTIISVVPSIDTGVCEAQTRRFNVAAAELEEVNILTISVDLPFAQKRWCGAEGIDKVQMLSDHRELSFGKAYGVAIEELRLLARAVFVLNQQGEVCYAQYVPEATDHPDYDAPIAAAKALL